MKTSTSKTDSQKLAGSTVMARLRVATAENRWKAAKEQARVAKRRRKEVKLMARRARKQAKQAKADLAEARKALAEAEARLAKSGARAMVGTAAKAKAKPNAKGGVAARTKRPAPPSNNRVAPSAPSPALQSAVQVVTAPVLGSAFSPAPPGCAIGKPDAGTPEPAAIAGGPMTAATRTTSNQESSHAAM